ncbi:unnamed protein product, partial [Mesorhabditis belari]|uniref:Annexin n=1 Tax=Mesorhabditis belari TaxID=2138241 RepID=A0AAF3EM82_9BILA
MGEEDDVFKRVEVASPAHDTFHQMHTFSGSYKSKTLSTSSSIDSIRSEDFRRKRLSMPMMYQMYESQYDDLRGTICGPESPDFFPVQASETLRKALSGIDTNDQVIIDTILSHSNFQRQKILNAYEDMYERNLLDDLEEETGGFFLEMALALFKPAHKLDTQLLYKSISNRYGDRSIAVEIACTRSTKQLKVIRESYLADYRKTLEKDLSVKVEGIFGKMLSLLLCKPRDEHGKRIDEDLVAKHATLLARNTVEELAKNLQTFEEIFVQHTWRHIAAVLDAADEMITKEREKDLETLIRKNKNIHSEIRQMFLTILRVARNEQLYFAEKVRSALSGDRPDHGTVIRIVVTRSEIDLADIVEEYKRKYHRPLDIDTSQTCSGDYLRLLTALITGNASYHR